MFTLFFFVLLVSLFLFFFYHSTIVFVRLVDSLFFFSINIHHTNIHIYIKKKKFSSKSIRPNEKFRGQEKKTRFDILIDKCDQHSSSVLIFICLDNRFCSNEKQYVSRQKTRKNHGEFCLFHKKFRSKRKLFVDFSRRTLV